MGCSQFIYENQKMHVLDITQSTKNNISQMMYLNFKFKV